MASIEVAHTGSEGPAHRNRHANLVSHVPIERDPNLIAAISEAQTIREGRDRSHSKLAVPDRMSGLLTGGSFILAMVAWLIIAPPATVPLGLLAACVAAHVAAGSIEFELGPGVAVPTTPVLFVSLFLLPPQLVPVVPLVGLVVAAYIARLRDPTRRERLAVLAGSAWHSMGPAAVFALAGAPAPTLHALGVCVVALLAQFACDAAASWVRNVFGLGVPARELLDALRFTFLVDLTLAPVGVTAALAAPGSAGALLVLVGPILLLAVLQHDRARQINHAVVLSEAFTQSADRARSDVLTGLRNRLAWEEAIARTTETLGPVGIVLADVDGLKATNDAFGHEAGDRLLIAIAEVIAKATPADAGATAARLGGDEFGILLPGALANRTGRIVDGLRHSLQNPNEPSAGPRVSASIGCGVVDRGADLPLALMAADKGVYDDKARRSVSRH
jgi:diguanylate cyclase (GGDEF)-like protein